MALPAPTRGLAPPRRRRLGFTLGFLGVVAVALGTVAVSMVGMARLHTPTFPEVYALEFTATGLVERVRYRGLRKTYCTIELANYRWINLSAGFPLREMPQEGQRYLLYAPRDTCVAAEVAAAGASGHILYEAGRGLREGSVPKWYMGTRPAPALGCSGLIDWQPPPR